MTESSASVKELCDLAGVSHSGYYRWVNASIHADIVKSGISKILNLLKQLMSSVDMQKAIGAFV